MGETFPARIPHHRITPPETFFDRRTFLSTFGMGLLSAPVLLGSADCAQAPDQAKLLEPPIRRPEVFPARRNAAYRTPRFVPRSDLTPRQVAAINNNFYEFLPGRGGPVWEYADGFAADPWKVEITGECGKPATLDLDDLFAFEHEERVYHFRCVERWAMNVPWSGFPLKRLLDRVEPTSAARYVRFVSALDTSQMPGARSAPWYPWPYHEGLRTRR